jgi:hypothetical protein
MAHSLGVIANDAPVTIPIRRTSRVDWPGDGEVAFVPAALLLAARGRCSCETCVEGFVHLVRRSQLRAV